MFTIKRAQREDTQTILDLIIQFAAYENMSDQVFATKEVLEHSLFDLSVAKCLLAYHGDQAIGYALYFYNFSTFEGRVGIYLEDLYIDKTYRGKGYGKQLLLHIVEIANKEDCVRVDWSCLDWNTPSLEFYKSLGASQKPEWITHRLERDNIENLTNKE